MNALQMIGRIKAELFGRYNFAIREQKNLGKLYYLDLVNIIARECQRLNHGVPVVIDDLTGATYCNPVTVSFYALHLWDRYINCGNQSNLIDSFLLQSIWLKDHNQEGALIYPIAVPRYSISPGWRSAMAQGLAISVFSRAFKLTHKPEYRDAALQAAAILVKPIQAGGCSSFDVDGQPYLEEIAVNPPAHILNGAIFALWGLYDLEVISNEYVTIKDKVVRRLARELPNYDLGYWSRYDLLYDAPSSRGYHILHIAQLESLYLLTKEPAFQQYSVIWRNYLKAPHKRARAFVKKGLFVLRRGRK